MKVHELIDFLEEHGSPDMEVVIQYPNDDQDWWPRIVLLDGTKEVVEIVIQRGGG
jgi:hypothetical protein